MYLLILINFKYKTEFTLITSLGGQNASVQIRFPFALFILSFINIFYLKFYAFKRFYAFKKVIFSKQEQDTLKLIVDTTTLTKLEVNMTT